LQPLKSDLCDHLDHSNSNSVDELKFASIAIFLLHSPIISLGLCPPYLAEGLVTSIPPSALPCRLPTVSLEISYSQWLP